MGIRIGPNRENDPKQASNWVFSEGISRTNLKTLNNLIVLKIVINVV